MKSTGYKSNVYFSTREFEMAHGRQPRGRGNWAFFRDRQPGQAQDRGIAFWHNGLYSDAKKAAAVHFAAQDVYEVVVGS